MTPLELRSADPRNEATLRGMRDAADIADGRPVARYDGPFPYQDRRAFESWPEALSPEKTPSLAGIGWGVASRAGRRCGPVRRPKARMAEGGKGGQIATPSRTRGAEASACGANCATRLRDWLWQFPTTGGPIKTAPASVPGADPSRRAGA